MNATITAAYIIAAFFMGFLTYRKGLKEGLNISKGKENPIEPIIKNNVVKMQSKKPEDIIMQGIENILLYDGTPQKKVGEAK